MIGHTFEPLDRLYVFADSFVVQGLYTINANLYDQCKFVAKALFHQRAESAMSHSQGRQLSSPARRHFLAVSAATVGKATAAIALASSVWSSSAEVDSEHAQRWEFGHKRGRGSQCFIKGTHILTARGDARIEGLPIGDAVETTRGKALPVKWSGRHTYKNNGSSWPKSVMPIRVSRFTIDENTPHRDLYLSPRHALFVDEFLMPVKDLVNGISVAPALPWSTESIEYF
jgi:hypothetical protein